LVTLTLIFILPITNSESKLLYRCADPNTSPNTKHAREEACCLMSLHKSDSSLRRLRELGEIVG
jgi:hypothetical protein